MGTTQRGQRGGGGLYRLDNISSGLNSSNTCTSECSPCLSTTGGISLNVMAGMSFLDFLLLGCWFLHCLFFVVFRFVLGTWVVTSNRSLACISRLLVHHFRRLFLSWLNHQLGLRWIRLVDRCREWHLEVLRSSTLEVFWSSTWLTSGYEMISDFTCNSWNTFLSTNEVRFDRVVQSLIHWWRFVVYILWLKKHPYSFHKY